MDEVLPVPPKAIGNYATYKKSGNLIFTSGHVPISDNKKYIGKVPNDISIDDAYLAAALCAELTISTLQANTDIKKLQPLNVVGFVNADETFEEHAKVLNGFTDTLTNYFTEKATRSAVGVKSLPLNVCVEVQCIFSYE
ncbi:MAG: RidA family protein [Candidatus Actinomarinales bacterium]|jgi:enamine deaminase RidA (YjgF/YER057c/UK114 family)|nr:RidA family protein [Candidatus Actinomarinales bacterium]